VFYIPGFDPFPSRRYRELFRTEGKAQAQISGYDLSMKADGPGWRTTYQNRGDDHSVITQFRVLSWSDVVKSQMHGGPFRLLENCAGRHGSMPVQARIGVCGRCGAGLCSR
jgi:hypothetical protein